MPINHECSCIWSFNNGASVWGQSMTACAWESMKFRINTFIQAQFMHVHAYEHAWTGHEQSMNCAWSYYDCGHNKHEIWTEISKFHWCCWGEFCIFSMNIPQSHDNVWLVSFADNNMAHFWSMLKIKYWSCITFCYQQSTDGFSTFCFKSFDYYDFGTGGLVWSSSFHLYRKSTIALHLSSHAQWLFIRSKTNFAM